MSVIRRLDVNEQDVYTMPLVKRPHSERKFNSGTATTVINALAPSCSVSWCLAEG